VTQPWTPIPAVDVKLGDRVRAANGQEVLVSRIEANFMGMDSMLAFIEDTPTRWFKMPVGRTAEIDVQRSARQLSSSS